MYRSRIMTMLLDARHAGIAFAPSGETEDAEDPADQALAALYAENSRPLLRLATLLVSDIMTAETIVQEAFTAICRERRQLGDTEIAVAFLLRAVIRGARLAANRKPPGGRAGDSAEYGAVIDVLRTLKPAQREALVLRYYASLSEEQAAAAMGVRLSELKAHVAGGMDILRVVLQRQQESLSRTV
ncbi:MAG TPA: sigma factor-like helix-turn-helix DNA-binding protein [Trebonia sp.]